MAGYDAGFTVMFDTLEFAGVAGVNSARLTAVFFMVPGPVGVATISTVAEPPLGTKPKVHPTSLPPWWPVPQVTWLGVTETSVMLGGKKSLKPTRWGAEWFITETVKVSGCPTVAGSGSAFWVMLTPCCVRAGS